MTPVRSCRTCPDPWRLWLRVFEHSRTLPTDQSSLDRRSHPWSDPPKIEWLWIPCLFFPSGSRGHSGWCHLWSKSPGHIAADAKAMGPNTDARSLPTIVSAMSCSVTRKINGLATIVPILSPFKANCIQYILLFTVVAVFIRPPGRYQNSETCKIILTQETNFK